MIQKITFSERDAETCRQEASREIPTDVRMVVPFAGWIDRHPMVANVIIVLGIVALCWVVLTYDFTTRI
jgi:hypothetical protein